VQGSDVGSLPVSDKGKQPSWRTGRRCSIFHFLNADRYLFLLLGVFSHLFLALALVTCGNLYESLLLTPAGFYPNASKKLGF